MHTASRALSTGSNAVPAYLSHSDPRYSSEICAKLVTTKRGRKEAILLGLNKPITIGRNPTLCSYLVADRSVSGIHCKIYAVRSPNGGVIVSCRDLSKNGIILNAHRIKKTFAILMDGDTIQIPDSLTFTCVHIWKEPVQKANIFDPTPPPHLAQKISLKRIGNYTLTSQCLGTGSFATVHLAIDTVHHCQVACKSIRTRKEHELDQVSKEVAILLDLNHPNINRIYDTRRDGNFIHLFLQLCTGGDLFTYVNSYTEKGAYMCEAEAKYIMYQLLKGLSYLHDKSISHRDLKPENILLHSPGPYPRIQIADFGLARPKSYQATFNVCGTVSYLPPEGILALDQKHLTYVGLPADCWSAGVTLYIMLSGSHPFDYGTARQSANWINPSASQRGSSNSQVSEMDIQHEVELKERIIKGGVEFQPRLWRSMVEAQGLVLHLLQHDPRHRATIADALRSKWIASEIDLLEGAYRDRIMYTLEPAEVA
ncbi:hypothetical protein E1B28_000895 [Marasmius oreades]|uniref:Kinase-like protein n=1 Tax=Marasmius oreades TaxID=181124 RepID=A0A9P8AEM2_9AGAR|nr:uncharacterized protein E1B28_000895 [Marasmius oreades]KAG7099011.1 hypothetical protein E1B28_000895 [Marasmius oreades]